MIKRLGYYIDNDLLLYWILLRFEFEPKIKYFTKPIYWYKKSLIMLNTSFFYCKKLNIYRKAEVLNGHEGYVYYTFSYIPVGYRVNKENTYRYTSDWFFFCKYKYVDFLRSIKNNKLKIETLSVGSFNVRRLKFDDCWSKSYLTNFFLSKFRFKNVVPFNFKNFYDKLWHKNFYDKLWVTSNQIAGLTSLYNLIGLFSLSSLWLFQRIELYFQCILFSNTEVKIRQHRRYLGYGRLYFRFRYLYNASHNIMDYQFHQIKLVRTLIREWMDFNYKLRSEKYFNHNIIIKSSHYIGGWRNVLRTQKAKRWFDYFHVIFNMRDHFDEALFISNKLNVNYPYYYKSMYNYLYSNIGGYLLKKLIINYGNLIGHTYVNIDKHVILDLMFMGDTISNIQMVHFMEYASLKKVINIYYFEDSMYYYKDIKQPNLIFIDWHWFTYWDGVDEHTTWGWYGLTTTRKRKSKRRHLIDEFNYRPISWLFKYINLIY